MEDAQVGQKIALLRDMFDEALNQKSFTRLDSRSLKLAHNDNV